VGDDMKAILVHNDEKYRKIQNDAKIAFMMAWHPRLGKNSSLSRCVTKDIAKIIVKMLTCLSPKYVKYGLGAASKCGDTFLIGVTEADSCILNWSFNTYHVDKLLSTMSPIIFWCPPLQVIIIDNRLRYLFVLADVKDNSPFIDFIRSIDEGIVRGLLLTSFVTQSKSADNTIKNSYKPSVVRHKTTNECIFKVKMKHWSKWGKDTQYLMEMCKSGRVKIGSEIEMLILHAGVNYNVEKNTFSSSWVIRNAK
jgi:hypothetical protein